MQSAAHAAQGGTGMSIASDEPMTPNGVRRDIAVVGTSAGGVEALRELVRGLPPDYAASLFIVLHVASDSPGVLHYLLEPVSALPVVEAEDGAPIVPGRIHVAPPDRHLVLEDGRMRLALGPRENRHRPSIDVLFRSAAVAYGPRVTGVVLTGLLDDGSAGLWAVKRRGGVAIVQDPRDALYPEMPQSALEVVEADYCLPLGGIAAQLARLARQTVAPVAVRASSSQLELEVNMAARNASTMEQMDHLGARSAITCPECGGALWEFTEPAPRFRCHVGHAYSLRTLEAAQSDSVESALWAALRGLEESEAVARRLADTASRRGHAATARTFRERASEQAAHAGVLRAVLEDLPAKPATGEEEEREEA
jgi:two-component system chemotaxis response regulator CheB